MPTLYRTNLLVESVEVTQEQFDQFNNGTLDLDELEWEEGFCEEYYHDQQPLWVES